ncbi:DUF4397 domain-containing protein [Chitinophaga vietnamensis]|uniref:DUF4397 domain-containing protein n=1 Tax=Chitinophaga vietnamensis TaxID=2593957 RepID=UPI001178B3EC|nr:DUF4397 domain-containing protein [Chitinophaga vietnamensis]
MKQVRMSLKGIAFTLLAGAVFTSCKKKDDPAPPPTKTAAIQLVHASPKTGELTAEINGKKSQDKLVFLGQPKGYVSVSADKEAQLKFSLDGNKVVLDGKYTLENKGNYSLFLYDTLSNSKIRALLLKDDLGDPGKGKANLRFLHLSPNTANVDIDVFKAKDSVRLASNVSYIGERPDAVALSAFKSIAAGDYRVKIKTKTGTKVTTIVDIPSVKLVEGKVVTLYLSGLTNAIGATGVGLQAWQHK